MGLFLNTRDLALYRKINRLIINKIIGSSINYFKIDILNTQTNVYGLSVKKTFFLNINIMGLILFDLYNTLNNLFGYNIFNKLRIRLDRLYMINLVDLYPSVGDIILWNNAYYDITTVVLNQFVGGQTGLQNNWSIICDCVLTKKSKVFIEDLKKYTNSFDNSTNEDIYVSGIKNELR